MFQELSNRLTGSFNKPAARKRSTSTRPHILQQIVLLRDVPPFDWEKRPARISSDRNLNLALIVDISIIRRFWYYPDRVKLNGI